MGVKIGHASISEKGSVNGAKGDSTGKEVCTREWYDRSWDFVLRPKDSKVADSSAKACEAGCANNNIGYGQSDRNTAYTEAKKVGFNIKKIGVKCNTDCSAFMTLCAISGGVHKLEYTGNAPTTSTMGSAFVKSGAYTKLTAKKYLSSSDYLQRGDILVSAGHHTVMVLSNGSKVKVSSTSKKQEVKEEAKEEKSLVTNPTVKVQYAKSKDVSLIGNYVTTSSLNIRYGAGASYKIIISIPKDTKVKNYGYYNTLDGKKWLYVQFIYKNKEYVGYASKEYLKKVGK